VGRFILVWRLAMRDLRRRPAVAGMLFLAVMAATTTLTLGLVLHDVTSHPYQTTRTETAGPDVVATSGFDQQGFTSPSDLAALDALIRAPGVVGHSGPYPVTWAVLRAGELKVAVMAVGRTRSPALIDQPKVTAGTWVRSGGVVIERTFAEALGVKVGDRITLDDRPFQVAGTAVTAAIPDYPQVCSLPFCYIPFRTTQFKVQNTGLIWLTEADARSLATSEAPLSYLLDLRLDDPAQANEFANEYNNSTASTAPSLFSWQSVQQQDAIPVSAEQEVLMIGAWLLCLLAVVSVAVLVGGRMAEQTKKVGLIKAVGGTPGLVAAVLLTENVVLALLAAAAGLAVGGLVAPLLSSPGAGLVGAAGAVSLTISTIEVVTVVSVAVAMAATLIPALRAARTSTVSALADAARQPQRNSPLVNLSTSFPVSLLIGLRLIARRPRRVVLSAVSIAITVTTVVAVLCYHATVDRPRFGGSSGLIDPITSRVSQVLLVLTVVLSVLAVINAFFITWATVLDSRRPLALMRALGATTQQVSIGISAAQLLPALAGGIGGIPIGFLLIKAVSNGAPLTFAPVSWLIAVVIGALVLVGALTAVPARIGARRPIAEVLESELT
jgi:putative ABC transport system permease protein